MSDDQLIQMAILARKCRKRDQERLEKAAVKVLAIAVAIEVVVLMPVILFVCRCNGG